VLADQRRGRYCHLLDSLRLGSVDVIEGQDGNDWP
jgi:hypothetical protein